MAWNASGTFNRITTTVSPAVGGTTIDVADQNTYTADVTAGINACLAKNGENAATGNLDMGGFKHTDVADAVAATEYTALGQVQTLIAAAIEEVGFSVLNTAGTGSISSTLVQVPWATEVRDPGNNFASNAYTCPTDGVYQFNACVTYGTLTSGAGADIYIYKDGVLFRSGSTSRNDQGTDQRISVNISILDEFDAGDVISVWTRRTGAGTDDLLTTSGYNYFNGTRINLG